jgi:hypothetical protein
MSAKSASIDVDGDFSDESTRLPVQPRGIAPVRQKDKLVEHLVQGFDRKCPISKQATAVRIPGTSERVENDVPYP